MMKLSCIRFFLYAVAVVVSADDTVEPDNNNARLPVLISPLTSAVSSADLKKVKGTRNGGIVASTTASTSSTSMRGSDDVQKQEQEQVEQQQQQEENHHHHFHHPTNLRLGSRSRSRSDPDTTCSDAYEKNPSKETCLSTKDHFFRPCQYCTTKQSKNGGNDGNDGGGTIYCYNADQAKWAKWFGFHCE